jgi:proteasome lid subunit RPN8/RPN11
MRSSVLTLRKPIPLARAIRWVPAGLFTPPRTLDDLALFITQSALREVMRHLRSSPEQELLGFLLGELYECPETGARYVVVNAAVRTGHAIAESDRILIPEEEWLGVQLEVRRRRTQLIGWYHSAPFVGPHPARADLDTHRALFTEPWQCGLVIATSGDAPAGAFFRSLMGERTGGGVLIPFYELPDDDEPIPADGRKRTLIDWVNYETRGTVERDESERRPFVPSRPSKPQGAPVILSVPSAPEHDLDDDVPAAPPEPRQPAQRTPVSRAPEPRQPERDVPRAPRDDSATVIPLTSHRAERRAEPAAPAASAGPAASAARAPEQGPEPQRPAPSPRPTTPPRGGSGLVMLPSAAELEELLAEPPSPEPRVGGGRSFFRYFAAVIVVGIVAYIYLWNSGRVQLPGFLAGIPVLDNASAPPPSLGGGDSENASAAGAGATTPIGPAPISDSAGALLSASDSPSVPPAGAGSPSSGSSTATEAGAGTAAGAPPTGNPSAPAASNDPAVQQFATLADSLEESIRNFQDRNEDFAVKRIACNGLAVGYRAADDAFIALASAHRAARESLDSTSEARYRRLVDRMGRVNEEFGESGCPRP